MLALVDCNNFFVSCERVFRPDLENKPVVVLSCNDGCVVSRSQEAKNLDIPMGVPFFKIQEIVKNHKVISLSSNFRLYIDISNRVMEVLKSFGEEIEVYSVDEAFINVSKVSDLNRFAFDVKKRIFDWLHIPVSVGIAKTKTLAKIANLSAKKQIVKACNGIVILNDEEIKPLLQKISIQDIWGIGYNLSNSLKKHSIETALDIANIDKMWLKEIYPVNLLRTVEELNGVVSRPR